MPRKRSEIDSLEVHPLTPARWADFERLFGPQRGCGGCWCMFWRVARSEFARNSGDGNRRAMKRIVRSGTVPGLVAYVGGEPAGWISVAPREDFPPLERSHVLKRLDDKPVWSIVCFYIPRSHRGRGLTAALIRAAIGYVRRRGGTILEAYPTVARSGRLPSSSSYMGVPSQFLQAGFKEAAQPSESRRIFRYRIRPPR